MTVDLNLVRARNTILAGVLGDAWGGPFDGVAPQRALFASARTLSDDTWLTLATCEAIARHGGGVGADGVTGVFLDWYAQKRFRAAGSATLNTLRDLQAGAARSSGDGDPASGGLALRATPLAFVLDPRQEADRDRLREIVAITHQGEHAWTGALAMVEAVRLGLSRVGVPHDLPSLVAGRLPDSPLRDRLVALDDLTTASEALHDAGDLADIGEAVALAILIASRGGESLDTALTVAASTGSHADTVAALAGQILGASGHPLPAAALNGLPDRDDIETLLERFVQGVGGAIT